MIYLRGVLYLFFTWAAEKVAPPVPTLRWTDEIAALPADDSNLLNYQMQVAVIARDN